MDRTVIKPCSRVSKVNPVSASDVKLTGFFSSYIERNRKVSIPHLYKLFEEYGTIDNFKIAAGIKKGEITRRLATDSDFYKWIEAVSWDLLNYPDEQRSGLLDRAIFLIGKAQEPDGYIDTYYTGDFKNQRFKFLENSHELYCGGHLIQAAIAHFRSTSKKILLDIAIKWADHIEREFRRNRIKKNDGHPEVEMALVELYRTTGEKKYLDLVDKLMKIPYHYTGNFFKMKEITGHAVRMMYLLSGATDYYLETGNKDYFKIIKSLYKDLRNGKYYITGGIGSRYFGEAFGMPFELPNMRAYCETCASIALMMWLYRMFFVEQNCEYFDLFETVLYNSFLAAVSLSGKEYFYVNPLASNGNHMRKDWYRTTCCPPNFQRFIASLPAYFYATGKNQIWINLYDENRATLKTGDGNTVYVNMKTNYPCWGKVKIDIKQDRPSKLDVYLRIPAWSGKTTIKLPKKTYPVRGPSYFKLEVAENTVFEIDFDLKAEFYSCNPAVESNRNCISIKRGPLVYCLEGHDNPFDLFNLFIPKQRLKEKLDGFPNNMVAIYGEGLLNKNKECLYYKGFPETNFKKVRFRAIPYFSWANRGSSSMIVWTNSISENDSYGKKR